MKKISGIIPAVLTAAALINPAFAESGVLTASSSDAKIAWGLGASADAYGRPLDAVNAEAKYSDNGGLFVGGAEHKRLWLTFDEGYENGYTEKILDILKEKNVRAVFFVTYDYAKDNPELIKRMITEGHTVGNHTMSHPSLPDCSDEQLHSELSGLHDYIRQQFGYDMYVMRPPKGEFSERVLDCAKQLGYTTVLWSFAYYDWNVDAQPDPNQAFEKVTSKLHPGAIYLLHAVSKTNTEILGRVIDDWRENGYIITPM